MAVDERSPARVLPLDFRHPDPGPQPPPLLASLTTPHLPTDFDARMTKIGEGLRQLAAEARGMAQTATWPGDKTEGKKRRRDQDIAAEEDEGATVEASSGSKRLPPGPRRKQGRRHRL